MSDTFEPNVFSLRGNPLTEAEAQEVQRKRNATLFPAPVSPAPKRQPKQVKVPGEASTPAGVAILPEETHKAANLALLRNAIDLVQNDAMDGVIVIGRQKGGGFFLTDHSLDRKVITHHDLFSYVGVIEALKNELSDITTMAPQLLTDGTIGDPHDHLQGEEFVQ